MAIAASGNVPVILLTIFWKNFTRPGAVLGLVVGPAAAILCIILGPTVLGDAAVFPLANVGLVSIPIGFAAAILGGLLGRRRTDEDARFERIAFQAAVTS
jgi:cation/acetate symporter